MKNTLLILICLFFMSCQRADNKKQDDITPLVAEWSGKEIIFPKEMYFARIDTDTITCQIPESEYKILTYVGPGGCVKCRLQFPRWKEFISYTDSLTGEKVPFLFVFYSKNLKDLRLFLMDEKIDIPVYIDNEDELNKLNHFNSDMDFQTFLLDKNNTIIVAGNPISDPEVKDQFLKHILGQKHIEGDNPNATSAEVDQIEYDLGSFNKSERKKAIFRIKNTGENKLVIISSSTTCGCIEVKFDKHAANPGESLKIEAEVTPNIKGVFNERVTIKCNTESKTYMLRIKGNIID